MMTSRAVKSKRKLNNVYDQFDQINGKHSWQEEVPFSHVPYKARYRKGGKIAYFNFDLAKEMGLIDKDHKFELNKDLENKLLQTFSLVIINEHDLISGRKFKENEIKPYPYMATRYLQLQHPSRTGVTSGDGRSIWNGEIYNGKECWDISSCGTGATCLSPATAIQQKFFETGDPSISYGCGYSDLSDGISAAVMSEVFHQKQIPTERTLVVIEYPGKFSINVRAAKNLLRPSHFFNHLKQNQFDRLKMAVDYYINKEQKSKNWRNVPKNENEKYDYFLDKIVYNFANISALFESEYIFCWLDWDGDNILMDGGIIDYGSVRQFDLFHREYRYDDVERWSTNLSEQKNKAKYIVQTFAQLVDYLKKRKKKNIKDFSSHSSLNKFQKIFKERKLFFLTQKLGFTKKEGEFLVSRKGTLLSKIEGAVSFFENELSPNGPRRVPDGTNREAVFCLRKLFQIMPKTLVEGKKYSDSEFLEIIQTGHTRTKNLQLTKIKRDHIKNFQDNYNKVVKSICGQFQYNENTFYKKMQARVEKKHHIGPITGDGIIHMTNELMKARKRMDEKEYYQFFQLLFQTYNLSSVKAEKNLFIVSDKVLKFYEKMMRIIRETSEGL